MNTKTEGRFAIIAALIVLVSAMLSPIISAVGSMIALAVFGIYKLAQNGK